MDEKLIRKIEARFIALETALLTLSSFLCESGLVNDDDLAAVIDIGMFDEPNITTPIRREIYRLLSQDHPQAFSS